jgi:HlyD family secretion protein
MSENNLNIRSEEVQEILGKVPSVITRWGITFIFLALAGLLVVAGIIKYPEIVPAEVTITTNKPPVPVVAKISGNIQELFVEENQMVNQNQLLAILQNTTNKTDLDTIEKLLFQFLSNPTDSNEILFPESPNLGKLQSSYSIFLANYKDFQFFDKQNINLSSAAYIEQQLIQLEQMNKGINTQIADCKNELSIIQKNLSSDRELLNKGIISQRAYQEAEAIYYQKKANCENLNLQFSSNNVRIQELRMQIFGLVSSDKESALGKFTQLRESANQLGSEIELWKEQFLLLAPVEGKVSLNNIWSDNQYVNANEEVLSITREGGNIKANAILGNINIGKVQEGQDVNIRFDAYNYMEYGMVKGKVSNIASVPRNEMYQVEIILTNNLTTTYQKELNFTQGMKGNAEIITEKRTILSRIFDKLKHITSKKYV